MKSALAILALLTVKLAAFASVDLGTPSSYTPYERYMTPVRSVMNTLGTNEKPNMDRVKELMRQGRSFRYHMANPYTPASPQETARQRQGDCKDKALWLCDQLNDPSARFVIGKTSRSARISHAWVMWQSEGRWWMLDCTLKRDPVAADSIPEGRYLPLYSYGKGTCYRHSNTQSSVAAVASRKNSPVGASK